MRFVRTLGTGVGGLATVLATLLFFGLVVIGGNAYRKDCITSQGTVSKSWSFNWLSPIPFLFRPSQTNCVVHVGTRVALDAIGIDKFTPSTPESLAGGIAGRAGVDPYWAKLKVALLALQNAPSTGSLAGRIAAVTQAHNAVASLNPPAAYRAANQQLLASLSALVASGERLQKALIRGDQRTVSTVRKAGPAEAGAVKSALARLDQVHAATG